MAPKTDRRIGLKTRLVPWLSAAALAGCAALDYPGRSYVLVGLMLFLPLFDRAWRPPTLPHARSHYLSWGALILAVAVLLLWRPSHMEFALTALLLAALPEEWFFRAYFMMRVGGNTRANLITSVVFSLLHGLTWGWVTALLVFVPSLLYGWLYQKTRDLVLLVLAHLLSNLVYVMFLREQLAKVLGV